MVTKALALVVLALVLNLVIASVSAHGEDTPLEDHNTHHKEEATLRKAAPGDKLPPDYEGPKIAIRPLTQDVPEGSDRGSARSPLNQAALKTPSCWHRPSSSRGVCRLHRECYPLVRLPDLSPKEGWVFGLYDSCPLYHNGALVFGVCCGKDASVIPAAPHHTNEVGADQVDKYMLVDGMENRIEEEEGPGMMDRSHVQFVPPRSLSLSRRPVWPPPLPTHAPSHTNQPWWVTTPSHPTTPTPVTPPTNVPWWTTKPTSTTTTTARPWWATTTTARPWWATKPTSTTTTTTTPRPSTPWWVPPNTTPWWERPQNEPVVTDPTTPPPPPLSDRKDPCTPGAFYSAGPDEGFRISGGVPATPHSHPWIAALFNGHKQFCGGSLIDRTHILTAAHCVAHMSQLDIQNLRVRLGAHNLLAVERMSQELKVSRVVRHKDYDSRKLYNDVAMLTLSEPAAYSNEVQPVCLDSSGRAYDGDDVTVAGWGSMHEGGPQPTTLHKALLRVVSITNCRNKYGPAAPGGIISSYLCAGTDGKDSCQGDSGGPLVKFVDGVWKQVGLVSWGIGCGKGHYPGVYSRVSSFQSWIQRVKAAY